MKILGSNFKFIKCSGCNKNICYEPEEIILEQKANGHYTQTLICPECSTHNVLKIFKNNPFKS